MGESKGNNVVTLQLTVPGLMKLFEGDPDIEVYLRKAVVAEFAKKKIGGVLNEANKAQIAFEVENQVGKVSYYDNKVTLKPEILAKVQEAAALSMKECREVISTLISHTVQQESKKIEAYVTSEVKRRLTGEITERVKSEVRERLNDALKAARI